MPALRHVAKRVFHVVAQIIEAQLVIGGISDIRVISSALFFLGLAALGNAHGKAEKFIGRPHPVSITLGEILVHGNDVHGAAANRVQVRWQDRNKRLALTCTHLGDIAVVQHHASDQLDIECAHAQSAQAGLACYGESLRLQLFECLAIGIALAKFVDFGPQGFVIQRLQALLE